MASLPSTMRALVIDSPGPSGSLKSVELPLPKIGDDEILIHVAYAGVNRADLLQKQGLYPAPKDASPIPGLEVSGHVVAVGKNVRAWKIGDAVCALVNGGGYAEYCVAHEGLAFAVPTEKVSLEEAAAFPEALFTAWMALKEDAGLKKGETVLIHGGASGIGSIAIPLAKLWGCTVISTAGTQEKCEACKRFGADYAIHYRTQDFVAEVKRITHDRGVDVVLDMVGGNYVQKNFRALAIDGRMVSIAFLEDAKCELQLGSLLLKRLTWKGATLRSRSLEMKLHYARNIRETAWLDVAQKKLHAHIHACVDFSDAEKTHVMMQENLNIGKNVIRIYP